MSSTFQSVKQLAKSVVVLVVIVLAGCAGITGFSEKPKVFLADIQVQEMKTLETAFLVQLRVTNPNDKALDIKGVSCDLEIGGRHFAHGVTNSAQHIPAYGTALVPVNVYASVVDMITSVVGFIGSSNANLKPLDYAIDGVIRLETGGFITQLPFTSSGELSFDTLRPR